jgi:outer membrane biosynthesis protein TonB
MRLWRSPPAARHDDIRISAIRVAFAVSLLVHALALVAFLPHMMRVVSPSDTDKGESGSPLAVQLVPKPGPQGSMPASPPPPEPLVALRPPAKSAPPPRPAARPPSPPPVMTAPRRAPDAPALTPAPTQPAPATDLAAYVEARRRERGDAPSSSPQNSSTSKAAEDENERQNRIIAANIGLNGRPTFGKDPKNGGGVFQIKTVEYSYAEFYFFGWNKDISRNSKQVIEVRKGNNADIQIAIIRRMIEIIREHEKEDFLWESHRMGRQVTLSARARDTAGLESFMLQEFFYDTRNPP